MEALTDTAESIAGMRLEAGRGREEVVFAFALWGSSQLILAVVQWVVVIQYHSLLPLMYFLLVVEVLLRMLVGRLKPVMFAHRPPGAIAHHFILPLAVCMLIWTLIW